MKTKQLCSVPPGSDLKPILGSNKPMLIEVFTSNRNRQLARQKRLANFGDMTYLNIFGRKVVLPSTPNALEALTMNKERNFANEPAWDFQIGVAFKRGILLMDADEHRHHRLILQQAFTPNNLKGYMSAMQPMLIDRVAALPAGRTVPLAEAFKKITLEMALEVFVGVKLPAHEADRLNQAFLDCIAGLTAFVRRPIPGGKWRKAVKGRQILEEFFHSQLPDKRSQQTPDLFSVLCHVQSEDGAMFTDADVVSHMIFVLFAAHDTSTTAISTMAYHLAKSPEWQKRAYEQSLMFPAELDYDMLDEMSELDLIFKESLRLNSPVPVLAREAIKDTSLDGYFIPKGTLILAEPQAVHSNPRVWNDPDRFDPERFTPERAEDRVHRFAWAPFGGGVHKCIGLYFAQMEIKTLMHNLLRNFELTIDPTYEWRVNPDTLGDPVDGLPMTLIKR